MISPTQLKVPKWPLTQEEFNGFISSLNDILFSLNNASAIRPLTSAPGSNVGVHGDLFVVDDGSNLKIYAKGRTLGMKSVTLS